MAKLPLNFETGGAEVLPGDNSTNHVADFGIKVGNILGMVMTVALLVLLFYLIWGGFEWITSAGESGKLEKARNRMMHAILGILILSGTLALFMFVQYLLGINIITFGTGPFPSGS